MRTSLDIIGKWQNIGDADGKVMLMVITNADLFNVM
jgi:hypothetical protein